MLKRLGYTLVAMIMSLATLGATVGTGFAASLSSKANTTVDVTGGKPVTVTLGNAGMVITRSPYTGEFELARTLPYASDHMRDVPGEVVDTILTVTAMNNTSLQRSLTLQRTNGYIYFDLNKNEASLWSGKDLSIYGFNGSWVSLPTHWVNRGAYGRLVAPISNYSAFALITPLTGVKGTK